MAEITGNVYKYQRPVNSGLEDIVINSLTITSESVQDFRGNINIHVPDLCVTIAGQAQYMPNTERLTELTGVVTSIIEDAYGDGWELGIEYQTVIPEPEIHQHYSNIRFKLNQVNI